MGSDITGINRKGQSGSSKKGLASAFYSYLKQAFEPGPSSNDNIDRTDNIIDLAQIGTSSGEELRVLDIGAGNCAFLRKFITEHSSETNHLSHLYDGAKLQYVAVDNGLSTENIFWQDILAECRKYNCCFKEPILLPVDVAGKQGTILNDNLRDYKPFDYIHAANILHELPPTSLPGIFLTLAKYLRPDGGKLILLDPDATWFLDHEAWERSPKSSSLDLPMSEWEANATWYTSHAMVEFLKILGYKAKFIGFKRTNVDLWHIVADGYNLSAEEEVVLASANDFLLHYLEKHSDSLLEKHRRFKGELVNKIKKYSEFKGDVVLSTIKYFAICGSHTRYNEVIKGLRK